MISWKEKSGLKNMNCLRAYLYVKYEIRKQREKYLAKYNIVPEFTTCLHMGNIIVGEIGEVKSQVVFSGETLAELQKLKKNGTSLNKKLIISQSLIERIDLPDIYEKEEIGYVLLDDPARQIRTYTVIETEFPKFDHGI